MALYDPDRRIWSGPTMAPLCDPNRSLGEVLLELLERNPDNPVQIDAETDRVMTRGELRLRAIRIAQHLKHDFGYGPKDIATIASMCSENLVPLTVALQCNAIAYNALNPGFNVRDMVEFIQKTQSKLMFCDVQNYETVRDAAREAVEGDVRIFILNGSVDGVLSVDMLLVETGKEQDFEPECLKDPSKVVCCIFCSSGSTGIPKQICMSHSNKTSVYTCRNLNNSVLLAVGSIAWVTNVLILDAALFFDSVVIISGRSFSEDLFFDLVEKYKVTSLFLPPLKTQSILLHPRAKQADFTSIKMCMGGYFVPDDLRKAVDAILPNGRSYVAYGSTECLVNSIDLMKEKFGTVGELMPNTQVRIIDREGRLLGVEERGELVVKKVFPILGYFKDQMATQAAIDYDGWFQTGDIGFFDGEGYLHVTDRKTDVFEYLDDVSPTELEELIKQLDGVQEACVMGTRMKDRSVELPTAVVIRKAGSTVSEDEIQRFVSKHVADHKQLRGGVIFANDLPRTAKGNVRRKDVRKMIVDKIIC